MSFYEIPLHWMDEHEMGCSCEDSSYESAEVLPQEPAGERTEAEMECSKLVSSWSTCRDIIISEPDYPKTKEDADLVQVLERAIGVYDKNNNSLEDWNTCVGCDIVRKNSKEMLPEDAKLFCCHCFTYIRNDTFINQNAANRMLNSNVITPPYKIPSISTSGGYPCTIKTSSIQPRNVQTTGRSVLKSQTAINTKASPRRNVPNNTTVNMPTQNSAKNLESDGDSLRSYSPQSTLTDPEDDEPIFFRHDSSQIFARDVPGKLSEYISNGAAMACMDTPKDKVTNQRNRRPSRYVRRKEEEENQGQIMNEIQKNTLSDHCYHLSQDTKSSMEQLEATSSESDEEEEEEEVNEVKQEIKEEMEDDDEEDDEIDVVSLGKKPRYYNHALQKHHQQSHVLANQQLAASTNRSCQHPSLSINQLHQQPVVPANQLGQQSAVSTKQLGQQPAVSAKQLKQQSVNMDKTPVRRPRGRPPGPNSVKRKCQMSEEAPAPKRTRVQNQRKSQQRTGRWRIPSAENEDEEDRRNQHNNMERQRRIGLKNLFDQLKMHVPDIAHQEKVAKVVILKQALTYVNSLSDFHDNVEMKFTSLQKEQHMLKKRLDSLQKKKLRM